MAASVETTQYERDLRSANKEWKRTKDSAAKWHHGHRPLPGVRFPLYDGDTTLTDSPLLAKSRPMKRYSDNSHTPHKQTPNRMKLRASWSIPDARSRSKLHAHSEIRAADLDFPSTSTTSTTSSLLLTPVTEYPSQLSPLYSYDNLSTPGAAPLTLDVFVKSTAGRETEKLVEKEYEVLDGRGEAVRGKKARRVLRKNEREGSGGGGGVGDMVEEEERGREDEGYELI